MTRVIVGRISVQDHPTDPRYQVGRIFDGVVHRQVVTGRHYLDGQLGLYIPEGCVVPESILREMWLWNDEQRKGRLAGSRGDRVKAKMMAGVVSEGLFYGAVWHDEHGVWHRSELWREEWREGDDVTQVTGIIVPAGPVLDKVWSPPPTLPRGPVATHFGSADCPGSGTVPADFRLFIDIRHGGSGW